MRFGVLGTVTVWTGDGDQVRIPESKVRLLLACLLSDPSRQMSNDRLADELWGSDQPGNPTAALQTKVWQLRRALDTAQPGARDLVVTTANGYRLEVEPEAIDSGEFAALVTSAREDDADRIGLLRRALALWRGEPFTPYGDHGFARAAVRRLTEARLSAMEDLAEARLTAGESPLLADELGELVARHPYRERLSAIQMRALYQSGRQGEALRLYERLRTGLAQDLGVDPSPELARLHRDMLNQSPALTNLANRTVGNLPAPLTELFGRDAAVADLRRLVTGSRLVTLTGPGGVGKTSLAIDVAAGLSDEFGDGIWLIDLSGVDRLTTHPRVRDLAALLLAGLGAPDDNGTDDLSQRAIDVIRHRRMLLVFDNCEHVVPAMAALARLILSAAPGVHVLVTGQARLNSPTEVVWPVEPLPVPDTEIADNDAVRMFVARARAASPGFRLSPSNIEEVAAICRRLDGLPLALELAAARVRMFSAGELSRRLDDRFAILTGGDRAGPARQHTLRAMIDWSWELLTEPEQRLLRRMSVLCGGTFDTVETIGDCGPDTVDLLARLVDRSLVVPTRSGETTRYWLLESVTLYGLERLREAGETDATRRRLREQVTLFAETAARQLRGTNQRDWLARVDAESGNIRSALSDAAEVGDADAALRITTSLTWYWFLRRRLTYARQCLDIAIAIPGGTPELTATARTWAASLGIITGVPADSAAMTSGDAFACWFLAYEQIHFGRIADSRIPLERARAGTDPWLTAAIALIDMGVAHLRGDLDAADASGEAALAGFEALGDDWGRTTTMDQMARLAEARGDYPSASKHCETGIGLARDLGLWSEAAFLIAGQGRIAMLAGDFATADARHQEAMTLARKHSLTAAEEFAGIGLALSARRQGDLDTAETMLQHWLAWNRKFGARYGTALLLVELGFIAESRGDRDEALRLQYEALEEARDTGDPRAIALALEGLAGAWTLSGDPARAARMLGTADALRRSTGAPQPVAERGDRDRIAQATTDSLGADRFAAEFDHGTRLDHRSHPGHVTDAPADSRP